MMTKQLESPLSESILSQYENSFLEKNDSMSAYRTQAMEAFCKLGFPTIKNEEWRFTNVLPLIKTAYQVKQNDVLDANIIAEAKALLAHEDHKIFGSDAAYTMVTINGQFCEELSLMPAVKGLQIMPLKEAYTQSEFKTHFGKVLSIDNNPFAALNSAMFQEGVFISVEKNTAVDKPIHLIKIILADENRLMQSRDLFVLAQTAALNVVESFICAGSAQVFLNTAAEVILEENAQFHHYDLQKAPASLHIIQRTEATQKQNSNYSNYTFTFPGASFVRNNLGIHLNDKAVESHLYGLYLSAENQLIDNHTEVHHKMPNGESNQLYKGIVMDKSKAVFNGKIHVYEDAQKTNAFQQSNNVLFSDHATVNAKPQLEIFADDVKCSHGTTIGQLNKEALFYLKSRGIGELQAKQLMVKAFAFDVAEKIKIPALKEYIENMISSEMETR